MKDPIEHLPVKRLLTEVLGVSVSMLPGDCSTVNVKLNKLVGFLYMMTKGP